MTALAPSDVFAPEGPRGTSSARRTHAALGSLRLGRAGWALDRNFVLIQDAAESSYYFATLAGTAALAASARTVEPFETSNRTLSQQTKWAVSLKFDFQTDFTLKSEPLSQVVVEPTASHKCCLPRDTCSPSLLCASKNFYIPAFQANFHLLGGRRR